MGQIILPEGAAAATPAAGAVTVYAKADGLLYSKDDAGVESALSGGGGGGTSDHTLLTNLNSANYTHLSATNATDLTDGGNTTLHTHDFDHITFPAVDFIGTPSHIYTLQELMNHVWSAGVVDGCALTDNGNGTVSIASGVAVIRAVADGHTTLFGVALAAQLNIILVDDATNYIYLDYTAGTPQFAVSTVVTSFNCMDKCIAWMVHRAGNLLHWVDAREQNVDSNRKLRQFLLRQTRFSHDAEGSTLGASGLALTLTAGSFNFMLQAIAHTAFDTSVAGTANANVFTLWTLAGSTWTETANSKVISTLLYNNIATGTVALANNKFGVSWVYVINDTPSELHVVMGQVEYADLASARVATPPTSIPTLVYGLGSLVGFVVYEKGAVAFSNVYSAFSRAFTPSLATTHNGLSGLQGGTVGEYYHLTAADVTRLANTSGTNTGDQNLSGYELLSNKATSFATVNDTLYPSVQAVKTYADGLVVGLLDDRGSYDASVNTFPAAGGSGTAGAILKGDLWYISVAGTLGGVAVAIGDSVRALVDTPGQTATNWSVLEANIGYVPENTANKSTSVVTDQASNIKFPSVKSVYDWAVGLFAPIASPTFTGVPAAPTAAPGTNTTQLATTAFVAAAAGGSSTQVPVRQTVLQGPVDIAGLPTFFAATYASLVVITQNVSTGVNSLVVTAAQGADATGAVNVVGQATANLTWPACTASNTNYLPVSISGGAITAQTPVILAPIYQWGGTPAVTAGQYTFNIQQMTMYLGNGTTAPAVNHVIVGEVVAGASTITSTVAYALMRRYDSGLTSTLPAANTGISKNSNLGVKISTPPIIYLECLTAEHGYAIGDRVAYTAGSNGTWYEPQTVWWTRNNVGFGTDSSQSFTGLQTKTGGTGNFTLTLANWAYGMIHDGSNF